MSDGRTHGKVTVISSVVVGVSSGAVMIDPIIGATAATGCLTGLFLDPDLDQPGITRSEGRLLWHRFLWPLGMVWLFIWFPYGRLIPHRHWLSHAPVVGTLFRLLYLFSACVFFVVLLSPFFPNILGIALEYFLMVPDWFWFWWVGGLMVSDFMHWWFDGRPSWASMHRKRSSR